MQTCDGNKKENIHHKPIVFDGDGECPMCLCIKRIEYLSSKAHKESRMDYLGLSKIIIKKNDIEIRAIDIALKNASSPTTKGLLSQCKEGLISENRYLKQSNLIESRIIEVRLMNGEKFVFDEQEYNDEIKDLISDLKIKSKVTEIVSEVKRFKECVSRFS